ncbi:MAG: hypothetical protein HFI13_09325 [Lachnospiraceae bacterium]|nr:hypothetical protein [Lachnospiraceae bacterium]
MISQKQKRPFLLFAAMMLITLSNSQFFINLGWEKRIEYIGLAIILAGIYIRKDMLKYKKKI